MYEDRELVNRRSARSRAGIAVRVALGKAKSALSADSCHVALRKAYALYRRCCKMR